MNKIIETITITSTFHFSGVDKTDVEKAISNLNSSRKETFKNILTKYLKVTSDTCSPFLAATFNEQIIFNKIFPPKK